MPENLSTKYYEADGLKSAVIFVRGHKVMVEAHDDDFAILLHTDMSLAETWATLGHRLSRAEEANMSWYHTPQSKGRALPSQEVIDNIWRLSTDQTNYLHLELNEHVFTWRNNPPVRNEFGITFKKFDGEIIKSVLEAGKLAVCHAAPDIMEVASPLLEQYA